MPHIKKRKKDFEDVGFFLRGRFETGVNLAKTLGCSRQTGSDRLRNPGKLTLDDLKKICQSGHIPKEELMASIKF